MNKMAKVVIVGRANVGKSTLFNRLSTDVKSLTYDQSGVTRDFISDKVSWMGKTFELIDTGGVALRKTEDPFLEPVRKQALEFLNNADLILFVCDGMVGLTQEDKEISRVLHKLKKQTILLANKIDKKEVEQNLYDFDRAGFKEVITISAEHALGIGHLLETIVNRLPDKLEESEGDESLCRIAIAGKPNVGKSSLMNILAQEERSLVSDIAGTTREALKKTITFYQNNIELIDTAGIRRKKGISDPLEKLMAKSSLHAIKNSDVVMLVIDASEGKLSDQELKLAFYAFEQGKALMLIFNKVDLVTDMIRQELEHHLLEYKYFLKKVCRLDISCLSEKNVRKIIPQVNELYKRQTQRFIDEELTLLCKEALQRKPMFHNEQRLEVKWVKQVKNNPISLVFKVNVHQWFGPSQLAFFENILRKEYDLRGVPLVLIARRSI